MWDEPQELNRLSASLVGIAFVLALFGALHYALRLPVFALRTVQLEAPLQRVDAAGVAAVVRDELHGNFFTVDLARMRHGFEKLPWVRKAEVRRHFPWQLDVKLEEQVALAHWNGSQLVNTYGEVFDGTTKQALPDFSGPDGSAADVTQHYTQFSNMLAVLGQHVAQINLSPRGAWQLQLQDGLKVKLGREQMEQRMARFVAAYPYTLAKMQQQARYVDLRYHNGFAAYLPAAHGKG